MSLCLQMICEPFSKVIAYVSWSFYKCAITLSGSKRSADLTHPSILRCRKITVRKKSFIFFSRFQSNVFCFCIFLLGRSIDKAVGEGVTVVESASWVDSYSLLRSMGTLRSRESSVVVSSFDDVLGKVSVFSSVVGC